MASDAVEVAANAPSQLKAYPTLSWIDGRAADVAGQADDFTVTSPDGESHRGRRILLATGVTDQLPPITGLDERWGQTVFHCPYCHGYELGEGRINVIATGPMSAHQAQLLTEWGQVTLLVNDALSLSLDGRADLESRGVVIEDAPIHRIKGHADVRMADGRLLSFAGLFTAARYAPSNALAEGLGCAIEEAPMGLQVGTDAESKTPVPGVFACVEVGRGTLAGIQLHRSLLFAPETVGCMHNETPAR